MTEFNLILEKKYLIKAFQKVTKCKKMLIIVSLDLNHTENENSICMKTFVYLTESFIAPSNKLHLYMTHLIFLVFSLSIKNSNLYGFSDFE